MKSIKNLVLMACMLFSLAVSFTSCHTTVGPREVGIKINKWGSDKGIDTNIYTTGWNWYGPGSDMVVYPTHYVNYLWTADGRDGSDGDESFTFAIKGGTQIGVDLGIEFRVTPHLAPHLYSEYPYDIDNLNSVVLRKAIMDGLSNHGPEYDVNTFVDGGIVKLIDQVQADVKANYAKDGIDVRKISMLNAPRYPEAVLAAITAKTTSTQKAIQVENEIRQTRAQAEKDSIKAVGTANARKAEADGIAYYNRKTQENLTPLLIEMERIKAWRETGGHVPTTIAGANAFPLLPLK